MAKELEPKVIVGLEVGTSKVVAVVGEVLPDGVVNVLGVGSCPSKGIDRGSITDLDAVVNSIQRAIEAAESMADCQIMSVTLAITGEHIQSLNESGFVAISENEVTQDEIDDALHTASSVKLPDGKLGEEDRTMIGNPHPDFTFGLTLSGEYKGFDLSMFFQGSVGNDILNILKYDIYSGTGWYNAPKDIFDKFWTGPGSTNENFAISANSRDNLTMSEWYIENGSYVRLKNVTLGYTFPKQWVQKLTVQNLRLFVAAQNLFTITSYSGLDPELGNSNPAFMGIDMGWYPQARSFMVGLSLKL